MKKELSHSTIVARPVAALLRERASVPGRAFLVHRHSQGKERRAEVAGAQHGRARLRGKPTEGKTGQV